VEFEHVIIAAVNDGVVPLPYAMADARVDSPFLLPSATRCLMKIGLFTPKYPSASSTIEILQEAHESEAIVFMPKSLSP
jgi:hypothetical protein